MADTPQLWGFKRTAKVVVPVTLVAAMLVFVFTNHDEQLKVSQAKSGECIVAPEETVVKVLQKRPCSESHNAEIIGTFDHPGVAAEGEPTPEENCTRLPDGLTAYDAALYGRAMEMLRSAGYPSMIVTNNADTTKKREYVCLLTFESRKGSYVQEVLAAAAAEVGPPPPG